MYTISASEKTYLDTAFTYHAPSPDQIKRFPLIRAAGRNLAETILRNCPDSVERLNALNRIEEAIMWANAAIARKETPPPEEP